MYASKSNFRRTRLTSLWFHISRIAFFSILFHGREKPERHDEVMTARSCDRHVHKLEYRMLHSVYIHTGANLVSSPALLQWLQQSIQVYKWVGMLVVSEIYIGYLFEIFIIVASHHINVQVLCCWDCCQVWVFLSALREMLHGAARKGA